MNNLNEGFAIPNLSKPMMASSSEIGILNKLNESRNQPTTQPVEESAGTAICPVCGATWTPSTTTEDGANQACPMCGSSLTDPDQPGVADPAVEPEQETQDIEQAKLESTLQEYVALIDEGKLAEAKSLLESEEASVICESAEDGSEVMLEKFVIKVDSSGHKTKKKVRTKKMKRTSAQKAALKKARKMANKGAAKKKRKKAMKARARMGLNESIRKTQISNAVQDLLESVGAKVDAKALERAIHEAYHMNEAEVALPEEKATSALETIFNNHGFTVVESSAEIIDGVLVVHISVQDNDSEIYLGDVADEVESTLQGYSVDYDEPDMDDEDGIADIDFYFVPEISVSNESASCDPEDKSKGEDGEEEPTQECSKKQNESIETPNPNVALFESIAGGTENVRCKMNPAFIKANQLILDAGDQTVFKALTESVATDGGYKLAIEVCNSNNSQLADLASGAEVTLSSDGDYFLLRNNPLS